MFAELCLRARRASSSDDRSEKLSSALHLRERGEHESYRGRAN